MKKFILFLILMLFAFPVWASNGGAQFKQFGPFFSSAGVLYPSIKVYHYVAGTTTLKDCWSDEAKSTAVAQPLIGDSSGIATAYCDGTYKIRIDTSADVTLYTWDNFVITHNEPLIGNEGTAYPSASAANRWQLFAKHDSSNVFQDLGINNGTSFVSILTALNGGNFNWLSGTAFTGTLDHAISADRTWTFPNVAGTVILDTAGTFATGSASAPSVNFSGQTTDGFFSKSATQVGEAINGVEVGYFDSSGNQSITGTYQSTKACATGYTRNGLFCSVNSISTNTWSDATACTLRSNTGNALPSDAKLALIVIRWSALSNNSTGLRSNDTKFWTTSGCTAGTDHVLESFSLYEQSAIVAGTVFGQRLARIIVKPVSTNSFYTTQSNAGANGQAEITDWWYEGYWD